MTNKTILDRVKRELDENGGKLSFEFIKEFVEMGKVTHTKLTPNMRVCVIKLSTGAEVIGVAQVLDAKNDVEEIGQEVARENAINELWKYFGAIATAVKN